jgi:hypothetical protein
MTTARVTVAETGDVGSEGSMRETRVAIRGLGSISIASAWGAGPGLRAREVLHAEQMRRDKTVPGDVR